MRPAGHSACARRRALALRGHATRGFTLIELMIVVALIAVAAGVVSLAMRDPASTRLQTEAERLSALLESARAESRATGLAVSWFPLRVSDEEHFRFVGLPKGVGLKKHWLDAQVSAEVVGGSGGVLLGPEPLIGAQRIVLRLDDQRVELATDGLGPFTVVTEGAKP
ncbi:MAG TPA: prepilin-type N-terminal cleavage/methylation domain-containing protein [Rubrivivax sp.]|nr:prepilin-type N-terminal cleavage/methylation domain-containing protein [Rubrivivax sp.]